MYFQVPPAAEAVGSAKDVFIGTVVENVGWQLYDFRVRVDRVFRGTSEVGDVRRMNFVYPNWPLDELPDGTLFPPCEAIPGWKGDVIAFALQARASDGVTIYNAASWISGDALHWGDEIPRTTEGQFAALADLPPTDTLAVPSAPAPRNVLVSAVALLAAGVGLLISMAFATRRRVTFPDAD